MCAQTNCAPHILINITLYTLSLWYENIFFYYGKMCKFIYLEIFQLTFISILTTHSSIIILICIPAKTHTNIIMH